MHISDIITPERVATQVDATSKKRVLETISNLIASHSDTSLGANEIFDSLIARERLGTTAIDHGVALPHGRVKNSKETIGAFVQLKEGIDCDAYDKQDVSMMFALLVPEDSTDEHLRLLARLAKMFSDEDFRQQLRNAKDKQTLYDLLISWDKTH